jgi:hypothetical protein
MADIKPKPAPGGASPFNKDHYKEVLYLLLPGLLILSYLLNRFFAYIDSFQYSAINTAWEKFIYIVLNFWNSWKPIALILSVGAVWLFFYTSKKLKEVEAEEEKIYGQMPEDVFMEDTAPSKKQDDKWSKIVAHAHSENPAEWRLAIIEADIILHDTLKDMGYIGEGVGEMLKTVDPAEMLTLDHAWEAHKIRNRIAHSGQDFDLSSRETRRVVGLFEAVFKEFGII